MNPDTRQVATTAEIAQALACLTSSDLRRLELFARLRVKATPWIDWADLVNEAVARSLAGTRKWPHGVPFTYFLKECIRSISSEESRHHAERPIVVEADLPEISGDASGEDDINDPTCTVDVQEAIAEVLETFKSDAIVLSILEGYAMGLSPDQVCTDASISRTEYASAQKRIRRWVMKERDGVR